MCLWNWARHYAHICIAVIALMYRGVSSQHSIGLLGTSSEIRLHDNAIVVIDVPLYRNPAKYYDKLVFVTNNCSRRAMFDVSGKFWVHRQVRRGDPWRGPRRLPDQISDQR